MRYQVTLPLPPRECSPNGAGLSRHWSARHPAKKAYREVCTAIMKEAKIGLLPVPVTVDFDFYCCRKGDTFHSLYMPRDTDNALAALKVVIDSLVHAEIISDDSSRYLHLGCTRLRHTQAEHQGKTCLVVTLTTAEEDKVCLRKPNI